MHAVRVRHTFFADPWPVRLHSPRTQHGMLDFLRRRTRTQRITAVAATLVLLSAALLVTSASPHRRGTPRAYPTSSPGPRSSARASRTPDPGSEPTPPAAAPALAPLPATPSADIYASEVAGALWSVDYTSTTRAQLIGFWQHELAATLPTGTPAGTTVAQAQAAAMSTLDLYLPSAPMWPTLARDHTVSAFKLTAISEPASWVSAVASGQIADPGLTARTVIGVQTLTYGAGTARRTSAQSQQLTVAMLCPPTTSSCRVEIIPPTDAAGATG